MSATMGPCAAWDPIWCCTLPAGAEAVTGNAVLAATEVLHHLSGQRFGLCEFTFRPCRRDCYGNNWPFDNNSWWQWGGAYPRPLLFDGAWFNLTCGGCPGSCSCSPLSEAWLPGPIGTVVTVMLDGQTLPASGYRVDDFFKLVRLGGFSWPICQDLTLADTEPDTWSVTVTIGEAVPTIGRYAVGELACEIVNACLGNACVLPKNATSLTRQGVSIDFPTFTELLTHGMLGLRWTDMFIATYNPHRLRARPQVYDVDAMSSNRRAGT